MTFDITGQIESASHETDLELLHKLRHVTVEKLEHHGRSFVVASSISEQLLEEFETLPHAPRYTEIGSIWTVSVENFVSCRDQCIEKLTARVIRHSLRAGFVGPTVEDLQRAPKLTSWATIHDRQFGGAVLLGLQARHPTLQGRLINTSRLCGLALDNSWARTASRWYVLGIQLTQSTLVEKLGNKVAGLKHFMLEPTDVRTLIHNDLIQAGQSDV